MRRLIPFLKGLSVLVIALAGCATQIAVAQDTGQVKPAELVRIEKEIEKVRGEFLEFYVKGDAKAITDKFAADAHFAGTEHPFWMEGKEAIEDNWRNFFQAFPKRQLIFRPLSIRAYGITVVETGYLQMLMWDPTGRLIRVPARYSITRVQIDGRWLIVNLHVARLSSAP